MTTIGNLAVTAMSVDGRHSHTSFAIMSRISQLSILFNRFASFCGITLELTLVNTLGGAFALRVSTSEPP